MSDQNFSAIRARLRYETLEDFIDGYARFISAGGMFIPMKPGKLKPIGTTIRFQFLLGDGSTALLGEGVVLQVRAPDDASPQSPVGMLIKFTKLAQESKALVDRIVEEKSVAIDDQDGIRHDIHNDRTPLPQDKESYERQTREAFDKPTLGELLSQEPSESENIHSKQTDAGGDLSQAQELADSDSSESQPIHDAFESDEAANDALIAAAMAVASQTREDAAEANPLAGLLDDSEGQIDPPTAEETAEPTTREAPEIVETVVSSEMGQKGPLQLAETAGGLKILAFDDDIDESAMRALEEFSFGAEEADIDDMFEGLFGGGDGASGGLFGDEPVSPPEGENELDADLGQPSIEFELPAAGNTQEVGSDWVEEEILAADASSMADEELVHEPRPAFSLEDFLDDDAEPSFNLDSEPDELQLNDDADVGDEEDDEPVFSLDDPYESSDADPAMEPSEVESLGETSEPEVLLTDGRDRDIVDASERSVEHSSKAEDEDNAAERNIRSLLEHIDEAPQPSLADLRLGAATQAEAPVELDDDEESLESLLASARREIEEKSAEEPREPGDILDQLLGDDLPPPPSDAPVFGIPTPEKKKKGFLAKLFDKD